MFNWPGFTIQTFSSTNYLFIIYQMKMTLEWDPSLHIWSFSIFFFFSDCFQVWLVILFICFGFKSHWTSCFLNLDINFERYEFFFQSFQIFIILGLIFLFIFLFIFFFWILNVENKIEFKLIYSHEMKLSTKFEIITILLAIIKNFEYITFEKKKLRSCI